MNIDITTLENLVESLKQEAYANHVIDKQEKHDSVDDMFIGKYCIIRTYSAGVHAGIVHKRMPNGKIILKDSRRLWRWWAKESISLSAVGQYGIKQEKSDICCVIPWLEVEPIEIQIASDEARNSIVTAEVSQQDD